MVRRQVSGCTIKLAGPNILGRNLVARTAPVLYYYWYKYPTVLPVAVPQPTCTVPGTVLYPTVPVPSLLPPLYFQVHPTYLPTYVFLYHRTDPVPTYPNQP